jgi:hypothetical protein
MKKMLLAASLLLASTMSYGACSTSEGIELCFELSDPDLSKVLTDKSELEDVNGDGINDIIKVDSESNELMIYLGRECSGDISTHCFRQPHFTGILNNKGFLVKDVSGDGKADLTVRTEDDVIMVYAQPGPILDDGSRSGEAGYISILGTWGLTANHYEANATSDGTYHGKPYTADSAFDGFIEDNSPITEAISPSELGAGRWRGDNINHNASQPWVQINFHYPSSANQILFFGAGLTGPVTVKYSYDGEEFFDHATVYAKNISTSSYSSAKGHSFEPTPFVKHIRVVFRHMSESNTGIWYPFVKDMQLKGWVKNNPDN